MLVSEARMGDLEVQLANALRSKEALGKSQSGLTRNVAELQAALSRAQAVGCERGEQLSEAQARENSLVSQLADTSLARDTKGRSCATLAGRVTELEAELERRKKSRGFAVADKAFSFDSEIDQ